MPTSITENNETYLHIDQNQLKVLDNLDEKVIEIREER